MYLPCDKTLRVAGNRHILILAWGRVLEFAEAARPPMKAGRRADEVASGLQRDTACRLGILQVLEGGEVLVGQCRVGQGPQVLGRVELRRVGRQEEQMDVLGDPQLDARMPAGAIEDQHDLLLRPRPHCLREGGLKLTRFGGSSENLVSEGVLTREIPLLASSIQDAPAQEIEFRSS